MGCEENKFDFHTDELISALDSLIYAIICHHIIGVCNAPQITALLFEKINVALETLTPREEKVVRLSFGFEDGKKHTLQEVGQHFELTGERVRQIKAKALRELRNPVRSNWFRDFLNDDSENRAFCVELFKQNNNCSLDDIRKSYLYGKTINWSGENFEEQIEFLFPTDNHLYYLIHDTIMQKRCWCPWPVELLHESAMKTFFEDVDMGITSAWFSDIFSENVEHKVILLETATHKRMLYWLYNEKYNQCCIDMEVVNHLYNIIMESKGKPLSDDKKSVFLRLLYRAEIEFCYRCARHITPPSEKKFYYENRLLVERKLQKMVLETTCEELDLSVRSFNCLKRAGINTIADLIGKTEEDMMKVRNLGRKSLDEVIAKLKSL